jgi:hypothetical protein
VTESRLPTTQVGANVTIFSTGAQTHFALCIGDTNKTAQRDETLVNANIPCEALLYMTSPDAFASEECKREVRRAEDDSKEILIAILRDLRIGDSRLKSFSDRQIMDLSVDRREERVEVEHLGRKYLIDFNRQALNAIHNKLIALGIAPDSFVWPPKVNPKTPPYLARARGGNPQGMCAR